MKIRKEIAYHLRWLNPSENKKGFDLILNITILEQLYVLLNDESVLSSSSILHKMEEIKAP